MKKRGLSFIILVAGIYFFETSPAFGQDPARQLRWEPWEKLPCMQGISASVMKMGLSKEAGGYLWGIRFRNDYDIPVTFEYKLTIGEESKSKQGYLSVYKLGKGQIMTDGSDLFTGKLYNSSSSEYFIYINEVCFEGMKCGGNDECYADCDKIPGKPNQPCGLSDNAAKEENIKTVASKSASPTIDNPNSPVEKSSPGLDGPWQRDDKGLNVTIAATADGLSWTKDGDEKSYSFKKINADTYRLESGKDFYMIKVVNEKRFSYWENGSLAFFYNRASSTDETKTKAENKVPSIDGDWQGEGSYSGSKYKLALTAEGITMAYYYSSGPGFPVPYKKISGDTYRYTSGGNPPQLFTVKFLTNDRFQISLGENDPYPGYYSRISPSASKEETEAKKLSDAIFEMTKKNSSSIAGTWDGDNGGSGIITLTDKGFNWTNQGQGFSSSFKKIGSDTYRFDDGRNYCIVVFLSDTKLDYSCNGTHYAYFTRR